MTKICITSQNSHADEIRIGEQNRQQIQALGHFPGLEAGTPSGGVLANRRRREGGDADGRGDIGIEPTAQKMNQMPPRSSAMVITCASSACG